jgi:acyl-CoA hydrolase
VDHVVTEYGVAHLSGRSIRERVRELIGIAHPNFREDLKKEAEKNNIW